MKYFEQVLMNNKINSENLQQEPEEQIIYTQKPKERKKKIIYKEVEEETNKQANTPNNNKQTIKQTKRNGG